MSGLAQHELAAPGRDLINSCKAGASEVTGSKMPAKAEGGAVRGNFFHHVKMRFNPLRRRSERDMQVVIGVGHGAEKVGLVGPIVYENRVIGHRAPPRL